MDLVTLLSVLGGSAGVLATAFTGVREFLAARHGERRADGEAALAAWREIVDRKQQDVDRQLEELGLLKRHIDDLQRAVGVLVDACQECELGRAEDYGLLVRLHEIASAVPGARVPPLPARRPPRELLRELDFLRKSTEQNTVLLPPTPPAPPGAQVQGAQARGGRP